MKRFVQWRLFLASEQCEASLADHVYVFFTEVSFLCLVSSLVRSYYSYLLIGYYVPGTLLSAWYSRVSTAETILLFVEFTFQWVTQTLNNK